MLEWTELIFRWIFAGQILFWGLNGFFHWKAIPPSADFINEFTEACVKSGFIMPTVKIFEVVFGSLLLTGFARGISLIALAPIVFVITGLHVRHNKKAWEVLVPISLPFLILVILNFEKWNSLLE